MFFNNKRSNSLPHCDFNIKKVGICDVSLFNVNGNNNTNLNWTEISIPEVTSIPNEKPDIENIDQVFVNCGIENARLISTPFAYKSYKLYYLPHDLLEYIKNTIHKLNHKDNYICKLSNNVEDLIDVIIEEIQLKINPKCKSLICDIKSLIEEVDCSLKEAKNAVTSLENSVSMLKPSANYICDSLKFATNKFYRLFQLINSISEEICIIIEKATVDKTNTFQCDTEYMKKIITDIIFLINKILEKLNIDCNPGEAFEIACNLEGTSLTGRKLIIKGFLNQKVVYTAQVPTQSVHSVQFKIPFTTFIIPYAKFDNAKFKKDIVVCNPDTNKPKVINGYLYNNLEKLSVDLCEEFSIEKCIEDIFINPLNKREIFKNITLFLKAKPIRCK